jgi:exodeoxyribonuclease VII small subunit
MAKKKTPAAGPEFEQSLEELEALVERLEGGELNLEESLAQFERGIELTRHCQRALADAEQRIEVLMERSGKDGLEPFDPDGDGGGDEDSA